MKDTQNYPFFYSNGLLYSGMLVVLCFLWFGLLAGVEYALYGAKLIPPAWVVPAAFVGGLIFLYWLCRNKLHRLYTKAGQGILHDDCFEIKLWYKSHTVSYGDIRRMVYRDQKRNRGLILSAKGCSLFLEEPLKVRSIPDSERELLQEFYNALEQKSKRAGATG